MSILNNRKDKMLRVSMIVLALLVVLVIWATSSLIRLNIKAEETISLSEKRTEAILMATSSLNQLETELIQLVAVNDEERIRESADASILASEALEESINNLNQQMPDHQEVKWLLILVKEMIPERMEIIALAKRNSDAIALELINYMSPKTTEVTDILTSLVQDDQKYINALLRDIRQREYTTLVIILFMMVAGVVVLVSVINRLGKTSKELDELNLHLEEQVQKRTKQLEDSFEDLTDNIFALEETQAKLVESEKMASLGVLVKGVAHELNTPIGICITSSSHLREKVKSFNDQLSEGKLTKKSCELLVENAASCLEMVEENLEKSSQLIQCFKKIAIEQEEAREDAVMVKELVEDIVTSNGFSSSDNVEIAIEGQAGISAFVSREALCDVLNNLIENAICHSQEQCDKHRIEVDTQIIGTDIRIAISDKGKGIEQEDLPKIFDPFFTTQRGKGRNGLGLAVVYNLVTHLLEGKINCQSEPGQGTTFEVIFPYKPAI
ncbi:HAMP domain-containing histidine kinase [Vibrio sp. SCSIO 43132]|uniref:sensor histidine kinase n=2 Tax=Vibrio TaxID=662 RepID=UPI001CAA2682|nr:HAMP domain-containing sensor histidine kinase [Vibrio sp. SCSIO 43132]UAB72251.1 HAMP domain-containing histidine kinase [Vibrio sp. SCSIO 43132]